MNTTERVWRRQYDELHEALRPWSFESDGLAFLSPDAPKELTDLYGKMQSVGYARGWM